MLPWQLYVAHAWPELAAYARARGSRYFLTVVDSQGGPWTYHLANLPFDFGWLAPLAVAWLAVESLRGRRALAPFAVWLALVYGAFTLAATKMQSYVLIAAPALFAAVAWLAQDAVPRRFRRWLLLAAAANAVFSVVSAEASRRGQGARSALGARAAPPGRGGRDVAAGEARGVRRGIADRVHVLRARDVRARPAGTRSRWPARMLRASPSRSTATRSSPESLLSRSTRARSRRGGWRAPCASAACARRWSSTRAKRPTCARTCCAASRHASVSSELPAASRKLARKLAHGATLVVLVPREGDAPAAVREAFPGALFLADETYARELDSSAR